jgi:hypothetical protein
LSITADAPLSFDPITNTISLVGPIDCGNVV